jgi:hypothetical protein
MLSIQTGFLFSEFNALKMVGIDKKVRQKWKNLQNERNIFMIFLDLKLFFVSLNVNSFEILKMVKPMEKALN